MPDKVSPGPLRGNPAPREAVCVHTKKVYDSCRDKECLQDLRVTLTRSSQAILEGAINVKAKTAELLWAYIDVEAIPFNRGFYTVDVTYFYKVTAETYFGMGRPKEICGVARHEKRTVLFGSEGSVRIFSSQYTPDSMDMQGCERSNLPVASVEVVEPVILNMKVIDGNCGCDCSCGAVAEIPECIFRCFEDELMINDDDVTKKMFISLGQFSMIKLERDIQLLMPAYDICMPEKESNGSLDPENPSELFRRFLFPVDEFFPPRETTIAVTSNNAVANNGNGLTGGCRR